MYNHDRLGDSVETRRRRLFGLIRRGEVVLGGNRPGKIYGQLRCRAGRRMKVENRVFFGSEEEAVAEGYRPCAVCMPEAFALWRLRVKS